MKDEPVTNAEMREFAEFLNGPQQGYALSAKQREIVEAVLRDYPIVKSKLSGAIERIKELEDFIAGLGFYPRVMDPKQ